MFEIATFWKIYYDVFVRFEFAVITMRPLMFQIYKFQYLSWYKIKLVVEE